MSLALEYPDSSLGGTRFVGLGIGGGPWRKVRQPKTGFYHRLPFGKIGGPGMPSTFNQTNL